MSYQNSISHLEGFKSCCSVTKSCLTFCDPMGYSMPGFPVLQYLQEFAQIHVQWVSDVIYPSHPSPAPFPLNLWPERATCGLRARGCFQERKGRCFSGSRFLFWAINGVNWINQPPGTAVLFQILADPHNFYRTPQLFWAHKGHLNRLF